MYRKTAETRPETRQLRKPNSKTPPGQIGGAFFKLNRTLLVDMTTGSYIPTKYEGAT